MFVNCYEEDSRSQQPRQIKTPLTVRLLRFIIDSGFMLMKCFRMGCNMEPSVAEMAYQTMKG